MLRRFHRALKPGGYFICFFHAEKQGWSSPKAQLLRKMFAFVTRGNLEFERGDILWLHKEFLHAFGTGDDVRSEFEAGGFAVSHLEIPQAGDEGGAVLVACE